MDGATQSFSGSDDGQWLSVEEHPPVTTMDTVDSRIAISELLTLKMANKSFLGFFCSNGQSTWIMAQNFESANYDLAHVEYKG